MNAGARHTHRKMRLNKRKRARTHTHTHTRNVSREKMGTEENDVTDWPYYFKRSGNWLWWMEWRGKTKATADDGSKLSVPVRVWIFRRKDNIDGRVPFFSASEKTEKDVREKANKYLQVCYSPAHSTDERFYLAETSLCRLWGWTNNPERPLPRCLCTCTCSQFESETNKVQEQNFI